MNEEKYEHTRSLTHSLPLQQAAKVSRLENFRTEVNPISLKTCCLCELPQPKSTSDSNVYGFLVEQMVWKNVISWFTAKRHNLTAGVIVFIWTPLFARNWLTKYFHESIKTFWLIRAINHFKLHLHTEWRQTVYTPARVFDMFRVHSCYRRRRLNYGKLIHQVINIPFKFFAVILLFLFLVHFLFFWKFHQI